MRGCSAQLKGGEPNTAELRRDRPVQAAKEQQDQSNHRTLRESMKKSLSLALKGAARLTSTERQIRGKCLAHTEESQTPHIRRDRPV